MLPMECQVNCSFVLITISVTDQISLNALLEVLGSVSPYIVKAYEKELPWLCTLLNSTKQDVRQLAAKVYAVITAYFPRDEFEKHVSGIMDITKKKNLEAQHGALMTLIYMMERNLIQQRSENRENLCNWTTYNDIVRSICMYILSVCIYIYIYTEITYIYKVYLICYTYMPFRYISPR